MLGQFLSDPTMPIDSSCTSEVAPLPFDVSSGLSNAAFGVADEWDGNPTLTIAALFNPLRRRVQDFIDRRFYRRKYDAARTLAEFAEAARAETDLELLTARLQEVVRNTMQPAHVSIWQRDTPGKPPR